jgi:hypothetical protein
MADINATVQQLTSGMLSATTAVKNFTNNVENTNNQYALVLEQLKKLNENFKKEFQGTADYLKKVVGAGGGGGGKVERKKENLMTKAISKLLSCVCKGEADFSSWMQGFQKDQKKIFDIQKQQLKSLKSVNKSADKKQDASPVEVHVDAIKNQASEVQKKLKEETDVVTKDASAMLKRRVLGTISDYANKLQETIFGVDEKMNALVTEFNPVKMAQEEQKFNREIRQTAYDIDNVTKVSKGMQKAFADIGSTVAETGVNRGKFQEEYLKTLKAGIKDLNIAQKLTTQQLGTERLLGLEAGNLSEHFRELNQFGRLTLAQTGAIGRGMVEVAKSTGITGDRMKAVVDKSKEFTTQLIKAAQFTAASNKNIMELVANAEKFGVGDSVGNILKVATSTNELISGSSKETQNFLYQAAAQVGRIQDLQFGTITRSKQGLKDLSKGMEGVLKKFGVESIEAVENLTDEQKFKLNIQLKSAYGLELGEVVRTIDTFKQSSKGAAEQLEEIAKKQKQNLNLEEKAALVEQQRRIKASTAMNVVTALNESAKGAQNMNEALAKFNRRKDEFSADIKAIGGDLSNTTGGIGFAYKTAADELNAKLKALGKEPIKIDGKDIENALKDKDAQAALAERLEKGFQTLQQAEKNAADPMTGAYQTLLKISDQFKAFAGPLMFALTGMLGSLGVISVAAATISATLAAQAYGFSRDMTESLGEIGKLPIFEKMGSYLEKVPGVGALTKMFKKEGAASPTQQVEKKTYDMLPDETESKSRKAEKSGGKESGKKKKGAKAQIMPDIDMKKVAKDLANFGKLMMGVVGAIAIVGLAIIAIGAVVQTVNKSLKIDPLMLGLDVAKILTAAAIIGAQVALAYIGLKKFDDQYGKFLTKDAAIKVAKLAGKLLLVTLAIVGLGAAILTVASIATFGISASSASKTASNVLGVMTGAALIIGAVGLAAYGIFALTKFIEGMAARTPIVLKNCAIAAAVVVVLAFAIVGLAAGILVFSNWILGMAGLDPKTIAQTVINVNMVIWGFNSIILGLAAASLMITGVAWAITAMAGSVPIWAFALAGVGAMVIVGTIIVGMMILMMKAFDIMISSGAGNGMAEKAETIIGILNTFNSVMLRLAPAMLLIAAVGVVAGLLTSAAPAIVTGAVVGVAAAAVMVYVLPLIVISMVGIANAMITGASAAASLQPAQVEEATTRIVTLLDAVNKIMIRLVPMLVVMIALGAIFAGLSILSVLAPVGLIIKAAFIAIAAALPAIIAGLILVGVAIVSAAKQAASGFTMDEAAVKELTDKIWLIESATMEIGAAILGLAAAAAFGVYATAAAMIPIGLLAIVFPIMLLELIVVTGVLRDINTLVSSVPVKEYAELAIKLQLMSMAMISLNTALIDMARTGAGALAIAAGLGLYSTFLSFMKPTLFKIIIDYIMIGAYVAAATSGLNLGKVNQSFQQLIAFTKNLSKFINEMQANMPVSTVFSNFAASFVTEKPADKVRRYLGEIQQILLVADGRKFDMAQLEGSVALFEMLARWAKNFASAMNDLATAQASMTQTIFGRMAGIFKTDMSTQINEKLGAIETVINAVAEKSKTYSVSKTTYVVAYMEEMARVMKQFGTAMAGLSEGLDSAGKMQSNLWMLSTKDWKGKTVDSQLNQTVGITLDAINSLMKVLESKIPDDNNFDEIVGKLELLAPAMQKFGEMMSSFGGTLQTMFQQTSWGMGNKGPGTFLVENKERIKTGLSDIFGAFGEIFADMKNKITPELLQNGAIVAQQTKQLSRQLSAINPALDNVNKTMLQFIQAKKMSEQVNKAMGAAIAKPDDSAQKLSQMSSMMAPLAGIFQQFQENIAPLTDRGFLGLGTSIADQITAQAEQISGAVKSIGNLVNQINTALKIVPDVKSFEEINTKMKLMSEMVANLGPILQNFGTSMSILTSTTGKTKSLTKFVEELSVKLAKDDPIPKIFKIIYDNIVAKLMDQQFDPSSIKEASQMIADMAVLLEGLSGALGTISTSLMRVSGVGTPSDNLITNVNTQLNNSSYALSSIMGSLKNLVTAIWGIGPSKDVLEAGNIIKGISVIMDELAGSASRPGLLQTLNGKIMALTKTGASKQGEPPPKSKLQKAQEAIDGLASSLEVIMPSMTRLVDAVWKVGPSREVLEAGEIIKGLTLMLNAIAGKPGEPGLIEVINTGMESLTDTVGPGSGGPEPTALRAAAGAIDSLAKEMPPMLTSMAKLVDVLVEQVGRASDVNMAAESLKAIPNLLQGVMMLQAFTSVGIGGGQPFSASSNAIIQSLNGLMVFLKVLNGGMIDTLINDANTAINKLSTLDQTLLKLAQSFMSIGQSMAQIGSLGSNLASTGAGVAANVPTIASAAGSSTTPGTTSTQQVQMNSVSGIAGGGNADVVAQLTILTSAIMSVAGIESNQLSVLQSIDVGVNSGGGGGKKSGASVTGSSSNPNLQLGGNSSDPTAAVGYNGGQPKGP